MNVYVYYLARCLQWMCAGWIVYLCVPPHIDWLMCVCGGGASLIVSPHVFTSKSQGIYVTVFGTASALWMVYSLARAAFLCLYSR